MAHAVNGNGAAHHTPEPSEGSLHSDGESQSTVDTIDDLLRRYTLEVAPDLCVKAKKSVKGVKYGGKVFVYGAGNRWSLSAKSADPQGHRWLHKITVAPEDKLLSLSTAKITLFKLVGFRFTADYDYDQQQFGARWRVTSPWSRRLGKLSSKHKISLGPVKILEARPHWAMHSSWPEMEGRLGSHAPEENGRAVEVDRGFCHLRIPRADVVLQLDEWRTLPFMPKGAPRGTAAPLSLDAAPAFLRPVLQGPHQQQFVAGMENAQKQIVQASEAVRGHTNAFIKEVQSEGWPQRFAHFWKPRNPVPGAKKP